MTNPRGPRTPILVSLTLYVLAVLAGLAFVVLAAAALLAFTDVAFPTEK